MKIKVSEEEAAELVAEHGWPCIIEVKEFFFETDPRMREGVRRTPMSKDSLLKLVGDSETDAPRAGSIGYEVWTRMMTYFQQPGANEGLTRDFLTKKLTKDMDVDKSKASSHISNLLNKGILGTIS